MRFLTMIVAATVWVSTGVDIAGAQPAARFAGVVRDQSGGVLPGVTVTMTPAGAAGDVLVQVTDGEGAFEFGDLRPGPYTLVLALPGFEEKRETALLRPGETGERQFVLVLATLAEAVQVVAEPAAVPQAPAGEAHLEERVLSAVPLAADRFEDALPLLPSTIRGPDGLLNMSGARAEQSGWLVNGINGTDPVTGENAIRLPLEAVQAIDVQAGIHSAQFGNATGGVTNVVTRSGQDSFDFQFQNFLPRVRVKDGGMKGFDSFTPRLRVAGPIQRGRVWFAESVNYRFVRSRVNELEAFGLERAEQQFESFDSLTQVDYALAPSHRLVGTFLWFPQNIDNVQLDTLHPFESTPDLAQRGWNAAVAERAILGSSTMLDSSFSARQFNVAVRPKAATPSELTTTGVRRNYFNLFDRDSRRYDGALTLTTSMKGRAGDHLLKIGGSAARSSYDGVDASLPVLVIRADGSLVQRIDFAGGAAVGATNTALAGFVEDQWMPLPQVTVHAGARYAYEGIAGDHTVAPQVEVSLRPSKGDRTVLKGGYGRFYDKLPLNAKDFVSHQRRRVTGFEASGSTVIELENRVAAWGLRTPLTETWNLELDRLLGSVWMVRVRYQERHGKRELVVDPLDGALTLSSNGRSYSRDFEVTARRRVASHGEINVSYVRSKARGNLNGFVTLFGTMREAVIHPDEFSRQPFDAPDRILAWGVVHVPGGVTLAPTVEYRTGFPFTTLDERQQVVGFRNRGGRFPDLFTLDLQATREIRLTAAHRARVGLQFFNLTNHFNPRDVQENLGSAAFGEFANSVDRQVRLKFVLLF